LLINDRGRTRRAKAASNPPWFTLCHARRVVSDTFPHDRVRDAFERVESGRVRGKVGLTFGADG
jgi:hypothetical protein